MKIYNLIILFFLINLTAKSQCNNNVSTDYTKTPTNNELPINPSGYKFLNSFDWVPRDNNGILDKIKFLNLDPNLLTNNEAINIHSNQQDEFYSYLYLGLEPTPQNGWEIVSFNTGFFPNGDTLAPTPTFTDFPYIILFNKYSSILRVYGILGPGYSDFNSFIDAVVVKVNLDQAVGSDLNGLFRLTEGIDKTLDKPTTGSKVASVTKHQNKRGFWFSADFQLAYDPCVCFFDSRIKFEFDFIESAFDFTAQINSVTVEQNLVTSYLLDSDFLNHFDYLNTNQSGDEYNVASGYLIYESIDRLLSDYIKEMKYYRDSLEAIGVHNKEVKKREYITKAAKYILKTGALVLSGGSSAVLDIKTNLPLIAPNFINGDTLKVGVIKELDKILPLKINTLVSNWVGEEIKPSDLEKPIVPTANFTQSTMRGKIQRTNREWSGHNVITPGSYNSTTGPINSNEEYPIYNESLGLFALLESPKIKIHKYYQDDIRVYDQYTKVSDQYPACDNSGNLDVDLYEINRNYRVHIGLDEELKYVINPALEIENYTIEASFLVENIIGISDSNYIYPYNSYLNLDSYDITKINLNHSLHNNIESVIFDTFDNEEIKGLSNELNDNYDNLNYNTKYTDISNLMNFQNSFGYSVNMKLPNDPLYYSDFYSWGHEPVYPCVDRWWRLDSFQQNSLYSSPEGIAKIIDNMNLHKVREHELYLKLKINVTFKGENSDGDQHNYIYASTFKIDSNNISYDFSSPFVNNDPQFMYLSNKHFNGQTIEGCSRIGMTYLCKAQNDITISGELLVSNGYQVIIESGTNINILPESIISPEITTQVIPLNYIAEPVSMPPVKSDYVQKFCRGQLDHNRYRANERPGMPTAEGDSILVAEVQEETFAFNIFPNPTNGRTTASVTLDESGTGELFITDISGRKLGVVLNNEMMRAGENTYQLPTEALNSGIYLIHLYVNGEHHVKRLVKN